LLAIINSVFVEGVLNNDMDDKDADKFDKIISRLDSIEKKIK
jgi:hypothetical protein